MQQRKGDGVCSHDNGDSGGRRLWISILDLAPHLIPLYKSRHYTEQKLLLTDLIEHRRAFAAPLKLMDELIQNRTTKKPGAPLQSYVFNTNTRLCAQLGHAAIGKSEFEVPSESKPYMAIRRGFRPKSATSISFLRTMPQTILN